MILASRPRTLERGRALGEGHSGVFAAEFGPAAWIGELLPRALSTERRLHSVGTRPPATIPSSHVRSRKVVSHKSLLPDPRGRTPRGGAYRRPIRRRTVCPTSACAHRASTRARAFVRRELFRYRACLMAASIRVSFLHNSRPRSRFPSLRDLVSRSRVCWKATRARTCELSIVQSLDTRLNHAQNSTESQIDTVTTARRDRAAVLASCTEIKWLLVRPSETRFAMSPA